MIAAALWSEAELGVALLALAQQAGLDPQASTAPRAPAVLPGRHAASQAWLEAAAESVGVCVQAVECRYGELDAALARLAPALLRLELAGGSGYLAVLRARRRRATLITPERGRVRVPLRVLRSALVGALEEQAEPRLQARLAAVGPGCSGAALRECALGDAPIGPFWLLDADPGSSFRAQLRRAGALRRAGGFALAGSAQVALSLLAWIAIGRIALRGTGDPGWWMAWVLSLSCAVPLQALGAALGGRALLDVAALLKRRLLCGALRMDADQIRSRGSGQLLATVAESEALESSGLSAVMSALAALIQVAGAAVLLGLGAGGAAHLLELLAWLCVVGVAAAHFARSRAHWNAQRFELAGAFLQNVLGHRTRVAQQRPESWHELEDEQLSSYLGASRAMDARETGLQALAAHGWLPVGLLGLMPAALDPSCSAASLALAVGGVLQAHAGLRAAVQSAASLCRGALAWRSARELFDAATARPPAGIPELVLPLQEPCAAALSGDSDAVLLDARGLYYRFAGRSRDVLSDCSLELRSGERVLLEGPSGGGKSTLAALLAGLREPQAGRVLFRSLDRSVLGAAGWRRCVASAPQFHDNHILFGSLAFNLLLGRHWPAAPADLADAHQLCIELGLGPLLRRMPAGIHQVVGESGWQLSHGERSRVFLGRALLQDAQVLVLDESFGPLDPLTAQLCVDAALKRARTLLVIAHP